MTMDGRTTDNSSRSLSSLYTRKSVRADPNLAFTILWSPLPPITWILPFIGHLGIADSNGIACDFQGPYCVGDSGYMAFGAPTRALTVDITHLSGGAARWDDAVQEANELYRGRMHNLFVDNCHSHVACALQNMGGLNAFGIQKWDMVKLCFIVFVRARFLGTWAIWKQFGPFLILVLLIAIPIKLL